MAFRPPNSSVGNPLSIGDPVIGASFPSVFVSDVLGQLDQTSPTLAGTFLGWNGSNYIWSSSTLDIGDSIGNSNPTEVLYTDNSGNLFSDAGFTRDSSTQETSISSDSGVFGEGWFHLSSTIVELGFDNISSVTADANGILIGHATGNYGYFAAVVSNPFTPGANAIVFDGTANLLSIGHSNAITLGSPTIISDATIDNYARTTFGGFSPIISVIGSLTDASMLLWNEGLVVDDTANTLEIKHAVTIKATTPLLDASGTINAATQYNIGGNFFATEDTTNVFIGNGAINNLISSSNCTFVGINAGNQNTTGASNTFLGTGAGYYSQSSTQNTFVGHAAGAGDTVNFITGNTNSALGYNALLGIRTGSNNVALGANAGLTLVTGSSNTLIGTGTDTFLLSTTGGIAIGLDAVTGANHFVAGSDAATITDVYFGAGVFSSTAPDSKIHGTNGAVGIADLSAGSLYLVGGRSTGSGTSGIVGVQTAGTGTGGGTTNNNLTDIHQWNKDQSYSMRGQRVLVDEVAYGSTVNVALSQYRIAFDGGATGTSTVNLPTGTDAPVGTVFIISDVDNKSVGGDTITVDAGTSNTITYGGSSAQTKAVPQGKSLVVTKINATQWMAE